MATVTERDEVRRSLTHLGVRADPPKTKLFLRLDDLAHPSPTPAEGDVEGLAVSPSGRAFLWRDRVGRFDGNWERTIAGACGWIGGGARVGGPRQRW